MTRAAAYLVLCLVVLFAAYVKGRIDNEAHHTAAALTAERDRTAAAARLAAAEDKARMLSRALEDAAYADVPSTAACLSRARVMRLRER